MLSKSLRAGHLQAVRFSFTNFSVGYLLDFITQALHRADTRLYVLSYATHNGETFVINSNKGLLVVLVTILAQTFFTFVRRHLMSLVLLSVWHNSFYLLNFF